jgi:hypothetical protein
MHKDRIAVLSAHEGSVAWTRLLEYITNATDVKIDSISGFNDETYRSNKYFFSRLIIRLKTFIFFPIYVLFKSIQLSKKYEKIIVITSPFFLPFLVLKFFKSSKIIVLQNDIYPEALVVKKLISNSGKIFKLILKMQSFVLNHAHAVVYISNGHFEFVSMEYGINKNSFVIHTPSHVSHKHTIPEILPVDNVNIIYSGTLGLLHDTSTLISYLKQKTIPNGCHFIFRTSGAAKQNFEAKMRIEAQYLINKGTIFLGDSLNVDEWEQTMSKSQAGIVFQDKGAGDVIFPSKVTSMLVMGQAVIAFVENSSYLAQMILNANAGWIIPDGNLEKMEVVMNEVLDDEILIEKRKNAYKLGMEKFSITGIANYWIEVLEINKI